MIQFKLNGKELNFPSSWLDTTFGQYIAIMENKSGTMGLISIFTGIDIQTLKKAKIEGLDMVIQSLSFIREVPKFEATATQIGKYKLPLNSKGVFDVQFESLGQFEDMKQIMMGVPEKDMVAHTKSYANYAAIYIQKLRDGEYDEDKAKLMIPEVMEMPAHEVITAGSFFFLKLLNLLTGTTTSSQATNPKLKKSKPVSRSFKDSSVPTRLSRKYR